MVFLITAIVLWESGDFLPSLRVPTISGLPRWLPGRPPLARWPEPSFIWAGRRGSCRWRMPWALSSDWPPGPGPLDPGLWILDWISSHGPTILSIALLAFLATALAAGQAAVADRGGFWRANILVLTGLAIGHAVVYAGLAGLRWSPTLSRHFSIWNVAGHAPSPHHRERFHLAGHRADDGAALRARRRGSPGSRLRCRPRHDRGRPAHPA